MARKAKPTKEWEIAYRSGKLRYRDTSRASTPEQAVKRFKQQIKPPPIEILSVVQMPVVQKEGTHGA
jgi:hypothetical protein